MEFKCEKQQAMQVAKAMDEGRKFNEIVIGHAIDPEVQSLIDEDSKIQQLLVKEGSPDWLGRLKQTVLLPFDIGDSFKMGEHRTYEEIQPTIKRLIENSQNRFCELRKQCKRTSRSFEILSEKQVDKKNVAQTIETAIQQCWLAIESLPTKNAKKVLTVLKEKLNPKVEEPSEK